MAKENQTEIDAILELVEDFRRTSHYRAAKVIKNQIRKKLEYLIEDDLVEVEVEIGADETQD